MAVLDIPDLKVQVDLQINTNGVRAITGAILNLNLNDVIDSLEALAVAGAGDVVGPGVAVDDRIVVWDGTSGKLVKETPTVTGAILEADTIKLATIESNATADQSDGEIKTAYENNADTNAFTDANVSKLSGIESNATADQSDAEIKTAYENNANTNAFTDANVSKLSGIESSATADQSDGEIKTAYQTAVPLISQGDAEAGTATGIESWSSLRVKQAIDALGGGGNTIYTSNDTIGAGRELFITDSVNYQAASEGQKSFILSATESDGTPADQFSVELIQRAEVWNGAASESRDAIMALESTFGGISTWRFKIEGDTKFKLFHESSIVAEINAAANPGNPGNRTALSLKADIDSFEALDIRQKSTTSGLSDAITIIAEGAGSGNTHTGLRSTMIQVTGSNSNNYSIVGDSKNAVRESIGGVFTATAGNIGSISNTGVLGQNFMIQGSKNYGVQGFAAGAGATKKFAGIFRTISAGATNIGVQIESSGGTINNALLIPDAKGNIGFGTITPSNQALLELASTSQALLLMRMTGAQASAITPANGMILHATSTDATFTSVGVWSYEGGVWVKL